MGELSEAEQAGRIILGIFTSRKIGSGGELTIKQLSDEGAEHGLLNAEMLDLGRAWLVDNHYVISRGLRGPYQLTDEGFDINNKGGFRCRKCGKSGKIEIAEIVPSPGQSFTEYGNGEPRVYVDSKLITFRCGH